MTKALGEIPLGATSIDTGIMKVRMRLGTYSLSDEGRNTSENTQKLGFVPMTP